MNDLTSLSRPLVFGDTTQIAAIKALEKKEDLKNLMAGRCEHSGDPKNPVCKECAADADWNTERAT